MPPRKIPDEISAVESVPVLVDLELNYQFGEEYVEGSNLADIADQLPATTFWAFAWEFFSRLPGLFLGGTGSGAYDGSIWKSGVGKDRP